MAVTKKKTEHYVDNTEFLRIITKHRIAVIKAKKAKKTPARIPEYVGECLLKIATHLAQKPNFAGYGFKDEMISDAVENCLLYLHNFNPRKSKNPFAYFTQIVYFAFLRRIEREKKHLYTKYKYAVHTAQNHNDQVMPEGVVNGSVQDAKWLSYENIHTFIGDYEAKLMAQKNKKRLAEFESDITLDTATAKRGKFDDENDGLDDGEAVVDEDAEEEKSYYDEDDTSDFNECYDDE